MATIGDGQTVTNGISSVWWSDHPHHHVTHVHALAYCAPCDAAYCLGCNRQWGGRAAYTNWGVTNTTADYGGVRGATSHGGH